MRFASIELDRDTIWRWGLALAGLTFAAQFFIIWSVHYPPQHDTPNHMARHFLEWRHLFGGELPPFYEVHYRVLPNLGADIVMPLLLQLFAPTTACKVFLSLAVVLYWLGPAMFIWQQGSYQPSALLASLLLLPLNFSSAFFWGFLNFYSGVGLAFLALVHFHFLSRQARPSIPGLVLHSALVTLLFLWHLAAVVIYGVMVVAKVALQTWHDYRSQVSFKAILVRGSILAAPMLPMLVLYAIYSAGKAGLPPAGNHWREWYYKLLMPFYLFRTYDVATDVLVIALWAGSVLALFGWRWWTGRDGHLWLGAGVFAAMSLLMPFSWGTTHGADSRVLPALMACALAILGTLPARRLAMGVGLLGLALVVRYGAVHAAWQRLDQRLVEMAGAFQHIPTGSRIMPVNMLPVATNRSKDYPEFYFAAWTVPDKATYVPDLFAIGDQQPLRLKPELPVFMRVEGRELTIEEKDTRANYDFVWLFNPAEYKVHMPGAFTKVFASNAFSLWRVAPPAAIGN